MYIPVRLSLRPPRTAPPPPQLLARLRQHLAHWQRWQQFDAQAQHLAGLELVAAVLEHLDIRVEFDLADLRHVPTHRAFLAVANQPGSLLHGLVVLHVLGQARPELRAVLAEAAAARLAPLAARLLVSKAPDSGGRGSAGYRRLLRWLHNEVPLALFPAQPGEPGGFPTAAERLLTTVPLPVVPIGLSSQPPAAGGWWHWVPALLYQSAYLPGELLSQRGSTVRVRLGAAIAPAELHGLPVAARLPHLRARLQALAPVGAASPRPQPALPAGADYTLLEADLAALPPQRCLVRCRQWEVYVAKSHELPHLLPELNYLRACTLRQAGLPLPAPAYADLAPDCHRYLLLYDRRARQLVGGCRLGHGKRLLRQRGRQGFGLHAACKLKRELRPVLQQAVELSQAFIRAEYQGQFLPLGLVWEALATYLKARPHYRYLLGQVSLSHGLFAVPNAELVSFVKQHCLAAEAAAYVRPRPALRYRPLPGGPVRLASELSALDPEEVLHALLATPEPGGMGVPPRLRPYFRQHARLLGVHLDPQGSDALHGAVLLDTATLADYTYRLAERPAAPPWPGPPSGAQPGL